MPALWNVVHLCTICEAMFPASDRRYTCWRHHVDPLDDWPEEETKPGVVPTYQLDGEYLKKLKGL